jgi:putative metallohydrolase (TIGR04338 family)
LRGVEQMQDFADKVMGSAWYRKRFPYARRTIKIRLRTDPPPHKSLAASARPCHGIDVYCESLSEREILHEIAHVASSTFSKYSRDGHGAEYGAAMLDLVREFMGEKTYVDLRKRYRRFRVPHTPKSEAAKARAVILRAVSFALQDVIGHLKKGGLQKGHYFVLRKTIARCGHGVIYIGGRDSLEVRYRDTMTQYPDYVQLELSISKKAFLRMIGQERRRGI